MKNQARDLFLHATSATVLDEIHRPLKPARRAPIPDAFRKSAIGPWMESIAGCPDSAWAHQSAALKLLAADKDTLCTTSTGSGKTMPFMARACGLLVDHGQNTIIVVPTKALLRNLHRRLAAAFENAGLPPGSVRALHGDVPGNERPPLFAVSGVVLATPDTVQSWLLASLSLPEVKDFLVNLRFLFLDECHAMNSILGTNVAFLLRRLENAAGMVRKELCLPPVRLQYGAASATISNALEHVHALTGRQFELIGEDANGAPAQAISSLHVDGPDRGAAGERMLAEMARQLASLPGKFIIFCDGRQSVERIAEAAETEGVLPYRAGYEDLDRIVIEKALSTGNLRGVVSTSALELGIDIAGITTVINFGLPPSRSAMRQRAGRAGRHAPGVFAILAPTNAFAKLGTSFEEFCTRAVEPVHVHVENAPIQFQNTICLLEENKHLFDGGKLSQDISWPKGFREMVEMARPNAHRPRDLEQIARLNTGNPHLSFPVRSIPGPSYTVRERRNRDVRIGTMTAEQAFSEAYPGAIYRHNLRTYRVHDMVNNAFESTIYVDAIKSKARTFPVLSRWVNTSSAAAEILENHNLESASGSMTEANVQITMRVVGYSIEGRRFLYVDPESKGWRSNKKKVRAFETTSVMIQLSDERFCGNAPKKKALRKRVAEALATLLGQDQGLSKQEIEVAWTTISQTTDHKSTPIDNAIVIYDRYEGGFRLSGALFHHMGEYIERLQASVAAAGETALLDADSVAMLAAWYRDLVAVTPEAPKNVDLRPGERFILAEGSDALIDRGTEKVACRLGRHDYIDLGAGRQLMYRYDTDKPGSALVPHHLVRPFGEGWRYAILDEGTDTIREIAA